MRMILFVFLIFLGFSSSAVAGVGPLLTYEGILTDASDTPITTNQTVTFQVLYGSCIVYQETQNITPGTQGEFSVTVGAGTRTDVTGNSITQILSTSGTVNCEGSSSITVTSFASRSLRIKVGSTTLTPDVSIIGVPYALNAERFADKTVTDFVLLNGSSQATFDALIANSMNLINLLNIFPSSMMPTAGSFLVFDGSVYQPTQLVAGTGVSVTASAGTVTISTTSPSAVTGVSTQLPLSVVNPTTTPHFTINQASVSSDGYLSSADWNMFNSKLSPGASVGGDLSGTITSPTVNKIRGWPVSASSPVFGEYLRFNGVEWTPFALDAVVNNGNSFGGPMTIGTNDPYPLNFRTGGSTQLTLTTDGKLGLWTTMPQAMVDIVGVSGGPSYVLSRSYASVANAPAGFLGYRARGAYGAASHPMANDKIAVFQGANGVNPAAVAGMSVVATENHAASMQGMKLEFNVTANGSMTSDTAMTIMHNGRVGIGETNPLSKLSVFDSVAIAPIEVSSNNTIAAGIKVLNKMSGGNLEGWTLGQTGPSGNWGIPGSLAFTHDSKSTPAMIIQPNGYIAINETSLPGSYLFHVNGTAGGISAWGTTSDRRYKTDITVLPHALESVLKMRGVSFRWNKKDFPNKNFTDRDDMGVIAQEVETVFPEAVTTDDHGYKSVEYAKLVAPLIESTRELYGMCKAQESQVVELERKIASLEESKLDNEIRIQNLEQENASLKKDLELIKRKLGL